MSIVVKVRLPVEGQFGQAVVSTEDQPILMLVPSGLVAKRFRQGEVEGYFRSELLADGTLEIGERLPAQKW